MLILWCLQPLSHIVQTQEKLSILPYYHDQNCIDLISHAVLRDYTCDFVKGSPQKKRKKKKKRNPETEQKPWSQGHCDLPKEAKHLGCAPHLHSHPSPPVPTGLRVTGCSPSSKTDWLDGSFHAFPSGPHNSSRVLASCIVSIQPSNDFQIIVSIQPSTWLSHVGANP